MIKKILIAAVAFGLLAAIDPAFAQTTVSGEAAFGWLQPYVNAAVGAAILFGVGYLGFYLKTKWGIEIDAKYREALQTFLERQAASLVAQGFVKVNGLQIDVKNEAVAKVAATAATMIPDTLAHFDITPDRLKEMIVSKIPAVPAVVAEVATTVTPGGGTPAPGVVVLPTTPPATPPV